MSNFQTFLPVTQGNPGTAPRVFSAVTTDSLSTILAAGYLNDKGDQVKANDVFYINYLDTSTQPPGEVSTPGQFMAQYSAPNMTLVQLPNSVGSTQFTQVAITAAQFNGMYATPKLLVAAPGANLILLPEKVELVMTYVSAAYAAGGVAAVQYDSTANGAGVIATTTLAAAAFQATASSVFTFNPGVVVLPFTTTVNKGLYLSNITGAFTTGDSTFIAKVWYKVASTVA